MRSVRRPVANDSQADVRGEFRNGPIQSRSRRIMSPDHDMVRPR
jgi:hypothetical protein